MPRKSTTIFEDPSQRLRRDAASLSLTLGRLFEKYTREGRHLPDGSLKTERYLEQVRQTGRYLAKFFGPSLVVSRLTPDRIHEYVIWRRSGGVAGRRVGASTIQRDLGKLHLSLAGIGSALPVKGSQTSRAFIDVFSDGPGLALFRCDQSPACCQLHQGASV
jgi:hypothetical protein